jgi:hypothetical protein
MALASDLMGLGVSPLIAARTANAGIGPLSINGVSGAATFASSTRIQCTQYLVSAANAANATAYGVALPVVGGDGGAFLGDDFIINNASSATLLIFCSTGVSISVGSANTSSTSLATHTTLTCYPITTTQWVGVKGS